ncbi:MADS-box protein GGM13-like [Salvia divinorum]|uniref:MADS-box protein GGM13-like n=1 Tax=Salvia divinorum TaxID=28513 RepID=A0ABD1IG73_SALDI
MGRGQFIKHRISSLAILKKRKKGLEKKFDELTTLSDVPACMIIHDPTTNSTSIWPEDSTQKNAEEELVKLRKKNAESKYPTWDHRLDLMDKSQLRELSATVRFMAQTVRSRIDFLKREAMMKKEKNNNNVILDLEEIVDKDEFFSIGDGMAGISDSAQLPVPDYYCPPPLNQSQDHIFSVAGVIAAMNVNGQLPVPTTTAPSYFWH